MKVVKDRKRVHVLICTPVQSISDVRNRIQFQELPAILDAVKDKHGAQYPLGRSYVMLHAKKITITSIQALQLLLGVENQSNKINIVLIAKTHHC